MDLILITGLMRSGTSLVAHMVHTLGVPVADQMLAPPAGSALVQPDWEDAELSMQLGVLAQHDSEEVQFAIRRWYAHYLARRMDTAQTAIADKSPLLAIKVREVEHVAKFLGVRTRWIWVERDDDAIDASVARSFEVPDQEWAARTQLMITAGRQDVPDPLVVRYERIIEDPAHWALALASFLGVSDDERVKRAASVVRRG